jgi:AbrB family looped-hinge helix DNA binding protein
MSTEDVTVMGERGQVVIPAELRKELGLKPKTKFLIRGKGGILILQKLDLEQEIREMEMVWKEIDKAFKGKRRPTEKEIIAEIKAYRKEKRLKGR